MDERATSIFTAMIFLLDAVLDECDREHGARRRVIAGNGAAHGVCLPVDRKLKHAADRSATSRGKCRAHC